MAGYLIADVRITDPVKYAEYVKQTPASIAAFGGRFIVRGGAVEALEGDWTPGRLVIIEFPSVEAVKEWWSSDMYAPARALRQSAAISRLIVAAGI